jgi:hypothetical protein
MLEPQLQQVNDETEVTEHLDNMLVEVDDDEVIDIIAQLDVEVMVEVVAVKVETDETDETVIVQPEVMVECEVI